MIRIVRQPGRGTLSEVWFAPKVARRDALVPCVYIQSCETTRILGFFRSTFPTKIVNLQHPIDTLDNNLDKTVRYEIRRAERDNVKILELLQPSEFLSFYNNFANEKNLPKITEHHFNSIKQFVRILCATHNESTLVMHAYILDHKSHRCRLLYSASQILHCTDTRWRAHVGRANRYLHWAAMAFFKQLGFHEYDLGGYALNTKNPTLAGINQFKDGFGGVLRLEYNYYSWPLLVLLRINNLLKK